jgi:uroporphyrinogen decarboxylase
MTTVTGRHDGLLSAFRGEPVERTPVWFMRQAGRSLPEYRRIRERATLDGIVRDPALCAEVTLQPVSRLGVDAAIIFADLTTPLPGMGVAVDLVDGVGPVIARPLASRSDVDALRPLEPLESVGPLLEAIRLVRAESPVPVIGFAGAPFTVAAYLIEGRSPRELTRTKALMHAEPATWDALMGRLVDAAIAYLRAQVQAGADALQLFDSWVGRLTPLDYRGAVLPHVQRLVDGLADLDVPIVLFGTGTAGLLDTLAETGADVIGVDWMVSLDRAWGRIGHGRAIQGNLDPHVLLAAWPVVERHARQVLAEAAGRPGHVFNLGHGVLPATDPDVLRRLVDLVHASTAR